MLSTLRARNVNSHKWLHLPEAHSTHSLYQVIPIFTPLSHELELKHGTFLFQINKNVWLLRI